MITRFKLPSSFASYQSYQRQLAVLALNGFGIYFGRFLRWNS